MRALRGWLATTRVRHSQLWQGAALLVIEGIPTWSSSRCGESYFTAQTRHEIERIEALRKSVTVRRSVPAAASEATDAKPADRADGFWRVDRGSWGKWRLFAMRRHPQ